MKISVQDAGTCDCLGMEAGYAAIAKAGFDAIDWNLNLYWDRDAVENGELILKGLHISPYEQGNIFNRDPRRERKLLMHKREIMRWYGMLRQQQGLTLIPLSLYFKGSRVKVQVGLCRGKKLYDKREDAARRDMKREAERALKEHNAR